MGLLDRFKKKTEERGRILDTVVKKRTAEPSQTEIGTVARPKDLSPAAVQASRVLLHPVVTEKAAHAEAHGTYTFVVTHQATKGQIRLALRAMYGVTPIAVRIANMEGKRVAFGRSRGKRSDWKKALVTLPKGQTIRIHEGV